MRPPERSIGRGSILCQSCGVREPTPPGLPGSIAMILLLSAAGCTRPLPQGDGVAAVNGIDIHYFVAGAGPVLVVHPGGPGLEWKYLRMPLVEEFATVVYVDPRGAGASSRLPDFEEYRLERMVEDLEGL